MKENNERVSQFSYLNYFIEKICKHIFRKGENE